MPDKKWGVISASLTLPDGTGTPEAVSHAIRPKFGTTVMPRGGVNMAVLSTGHAAAKGDTNPSYFHVRVVFGGEDVGVSGGLLRREREQVAERGGLSGPRRQRGERPRDAQSRGSRADERAQLHALDELLQRRFPEFTCSEFNDFFVILLDSAYTGNPANPMDKNLAFYTGMGNVNYPVGVNLAYGNTGLFTQCRNGTTGCFGTEGTITTCMGTGDLAGTGFDDPRAGYVRYQQPLRSGDGLVETTGNVKPARSSSFASRSGTPAITSSIRSRWSTASSGRSTRPSRAR